MCLSTIKQIFSLLTILIVLSLDCRSQSNNYNVKLGPVYIDLSSTTGITYNSNVSYVDENPISDLIFQSSINANGIWELTSSQDINFNLGLGYAYYVNNPKLSGLENQAGFAPKSEISVDLIIGNFDITLYDQISYLTNPSEVTRLENDSTESTDRDFVFYQRISNEVGAKIQSDFNIIQAELGLGRRDIIPLSDQFSFTENYEYFGTLRLSKQLRESLVIGINAQGSSITYQEDVQNNGLTFSIGPFAQWQATDKISINSSLSHFSSSFENNGIVQDQSDSNGVNYSLGLNYQQSEVLTHTLTIAQSISTGSLSNTTTNDSIEYAIDWSGLKDYPIKANVSYSERSDSNSIFGENAKIWNAGINMNRQLSKKLKFSVFTSFDNKQTDAENRDYTQLQIGINFTYDL